MIASCLSKRCPVPEHGSHKSDNLQNFYERTDTIPSMSKKVRRTPPASSTSVSRFMKRLPRADTAPEIGLRRELHRRGVRFRLHRRDLPGRPDIVVVKLRLAIFVDGCFWHGCPEHGVAPKANAQWWAEKITANRERDARKDMELRVMGWRPLHVWEHEDAATVAEQIAQEWRDKN